MRSLLRRPSGSNGTNFQTPNDPYGQGFFNTTALGWDGNYWPITSFLSGSFFARGVNATYTGPIL